MFLATYSFLDEKGKLIPIKDIEIENLRVVVKGRQFSVLDEDLVIDHRMQRLSVWVTPWKYARDKSCPIRVAFRFRLHGDEKFRTYIDKFHYSPIQTVEEAKKRSIRMNQ